MFQKQGVLYCQGGNSASWESKEELYLFDEVGEKKNARGHIFFSLEALCFVF
jgi:hypothetical protein